MNNKRCYIVKDNDFIIAVLSSRELAEQFIGRLITDGSIKSYYIRDYLYINKLDPYPYIDKLE